MKTQIVQIGNSRGVRIPNSFLKQSKLEGEIDISLRDEGILLSRSRKPREGWAEALEKMAAVGEDELLDAESLTPTEWDLSEWEW